MIAAVFNFMPHSIPLVPHSSSTCNTAILLLQTLYLEWAKLRMKNALLVGIKWVGAGAAMVNKCQQLYRIWH